MMTNVPIALNIVPDPLITCVNPVVDPDKSWLTTSITDVNLLQVNAAAAYGISALLENLY